MMNIEILSNIEIFADGADIAGMLEMYKKPYVKGFTTNPTLMKKAGIVNYVQFAKEAICAIPDRPISFEVFTDEFDTMAQEARVISSWGKNVFVKIPVMNTKGKSAVPLIRELSNEGVNLNITAMLTFEQAVSVIDVLSDTTNNYVSIFAGRIADTGVDPMPIMKKTKEYAQQKSGVKTLWASCREVYNIIQAEQCGVDVITVQNNILAKIPLFGRDLLELSLDTVVMFANDSKTLGFTVI